ncbi:hypothetical protein BMF94_0873 [Rhodotorula taiwanensis]|uniref:peptidylprolyl isomerase n=1 Tax=Rhodotorula taiwanensis TaxID=741276 RepID=A0A2S5BHA6_9BASI|nr:hypothetical protein BMF94_0873 [Rhodotorula taiwanensis]
MSEQRGYIDFAAGDQATHGEALKRYKDLAAWLERNGSKYGLPARLAELDHSGRETVVAVYGGDAQVELASEDLSPPRSLRLPRLRFAVSSSPALKKTTANFLALLTDEKKLVSKRPPNPPLRYVETPVFRIESDFIAQTGDITRRDGSGGESIYGGSFNDEKEGLKIAFQKGTLAMANSGKNCERSQLGCLQYSAVGLTPVPFFVTLTDDPSKLKKLTGKYVAFAQVDLLDADSLECLRQLDALADGRGGTVKPVWIDECGLEQ